MLQRKLLVASVALTAVLTFTTYSAVAGDRTPASHADVHVIRAVGVEDFDPNGLIYSTFRFDPGRSFPHEGDRILLRDRDRSAAPHTLTVVRPRQVPGSFDDIFFCEPCNEALDAHFATDPPTRKVEIGDDGLNAPGDSLMIFDGQGIGANVTAPAGTVLHFVCAFHPWMQGRLVVG